MDDDVNKRRKLIALVILFSAFILVALYIANFIYKVYHENRAATDKIADKSIVCSSFVFDIIPESIEYKNKTISFKVKNTIGERFENLMVETPKAQYKYRMIAFDSGKVQNIAVSNIEPEWEIGVYPENCPQNKKTFDVK